jgi:ketosteroid isomerase-like protein
VSDLETLTALNDDYIASVQNSDVKRFDEILADDFLNTNPDGSLVDRAGFLKQIAPKARISGLACHDVNVRVMGEFAIIHARTSYTLSDGRPGNGRYTDIWAKRNGKWLCVAAQVARN